VPSCLVSVRDTIRRQIADIHAQTEVHRATHQEKFTGRPKDLDKGLHGLPLLIGCGFALHWDLEKVKKPSEGKSRLMTRKKPQSMPQYTKSFFRGKDNTWNTLLHILIEMKDRNNIPIETIYYCIPIFVVSCSQILFTERIRGDILCKTLQTNLKTYNETVSQLPRMDESLAEWKKEDIYQRKLKAIDVFIHSCLTILGTDSSLKARCHHVALYLESLRLIEWTAKPKSMYRDYLLTLQAGTEKHYCVVFVRTSSSQDHSDDHTHRDDHTHSDDHHCACRHSR